MANKKGFTGFDPTRQDRHNPAVQEAVQTVVSDEVRFGVFTPRSVRNLFNKLAVEDTEAQGREVSVKELVNQALEDYLKKRGRL